MNELRTKLISTVFINTMPIHPILYFALFFLLITPLQDAFGAENDITFDQIFLEDGLSQSIVTCICQDENGYMWFGTEDGLNRYDGYQFDILRHHPQNPNSLSYNNVTALYAGNSDLIWIGTFYSGLNLLHLKTKKITRFRNDPNNPNTISHDNINAILEDRSGNLWIATDMGLNLLSAGEVLDSSATFIHFLHDENRSNSLSHNLVRSIYQDNKGIIWIGTDDGLNKLEFHEGNEVAATFITYKNDPKNNFSISHNEIYCIFEDKSETLWIGTKGGGLNRFDRQKEQFTRYVHDPSVEYSLSHNDVNVIFEDKSGLMWIGTNGGGINIFDREKESFVSYVNDPHDPTSLSYNEVRAIFQDESGLIWIGTYGGGVDKVDLSKKQFLLYTNDPNNSNSLNQEIVWSIYEDENGFIWVGTHGGGLNKFDRNKRRWIHYLNNPDDPFSLSNNIVRVVMEDKSGSLWIGTHGGGVCLFDRDTGKFIRFQNDPNNPGSLSHNEIRTIYQDRAGYIWIGTYGGGLNKYIPGSAPRFVHYRYDPNDTHSLSNDIVRVIFEDTSGGLWIGTEGGGLNKLDQNNNIFIHYRANPANPDGLNNDYIFSIHEDREGFLWLGTWGGGLNRFDKENNKFMAFTESDGLPNAAIYGILEDKDGDLWLSTNNGLSKFNPQNKTFRNFSIEDGLQSNEFNGGSYFQNKEGEMFFGGIKGFNSFFPLQITDNPYVPPVVITSFQKLNKEVSFDKPITEIEELNLSYKDYVISFEFAALDFTAPEKNLYAYKMEGLDQDWMYTHAKKRYATYTTLSPGRYVFKVKGSNNDGIWNEEGTAIVLNIKPPFWQTWWFRALGMLVILGLIFQVYRKRLKTVRLNIELRAAHDAQMSIMPQKDPQIDGFDISGICIPANNVGGDFFDYFWLDEDNNRFGFAIGDVSGKAMGSAMTAIMTTGMIYSKIGSGSIAIKDVMTQLNRPLFLKTERKMFIAVSLASLDIKAKKMTFTNAGLSEPLLKSGPIVRSIASVGLKHPLGLIKDTIYQEKQIALKKGDIFIFLTDGILEAQNHNRELYGEARIKKMLQNLNTDKISASEIKTILIEDIHQFAGNSPQHDDMTLIVIKCL